MKLFISRFFSINLPNGNSMIDNFQQTFPRAKAYCGALAILCAASSVGQYFIDPTGANAAVILGAGLGVLSLWPWTLVGIMPINYQLMDGEGKSEPEAS